MTPKTPPAEFRRFTEDIFAAYGGSAPPKDVQDRMTDAFGSIALLGYEEGKRQATLTTFIQGVTVGLLLANLMLLLARW